MTQACAASAKGEKAPMGPALLAQRIPSLRIPSLAGITIRKLSNVHVPRLPRGCPTLLGSFLAIPRYTCSFWFSLVTKVDLIGIPTIVNKLNSARIPQFQYALMEQLYWSMSCRAEALAFFDEIGMGTVDNVSKTLATLSCACPGTASRMRWHKVRHPRDDRRSLMCFRRWDEAACGRTAAPSGRRGCAHHPHRTFHGSDQAQLPGGVDHIVCA